jgi:hypothetical protein
MNKIKIKKKKPPTFTKSFYAGWGSAQESEMGPAIVCAVALWVWHIQFPCEEVATDYLRAFSSHQVGFISQSHSLRFIQHFAGWTIVFTYVTESILPKSQQARINYPYVPDGELFHIICLRSHKQEVTKLGLKSLISTTSQKISQRNLRRYATTWYGRKSPELQTGFHSCYVPWVSVAEVFP